MSTKLSQATAPLPTTIYVKTSDGCEYLGDDEVYMAAMTKAEDLSVDDGQVEVGEYRLVRKLLVVNETKVLAQTLVEVKSGEEDETY